MQPEAQQTPPVVTPTPAGDPGAPEGTPKKKIPKTVKVLLIVVAVIIALIVAGVIAGSAILKNNDKEVKGFLSAVYASDYDAGYEYFSPQLKEVQSAEVFEQQAKTIKAAGVDDSCTPKWTTNTAGASTETGKTKEIGGTLECKKGNFSANFKLVKQGEEYKLYSYSMQPK